MSIKLRYALAIILIFSMSKCMHSYKNDKRGIPVIPLKDFFKNPEKTGFALSPDGKHIAFMQPWKDRMNVHVMKGKGKVKRLTGAKERDISYFFWANNERIVYVKDTKGDENFRLYAVNIDGKKRKDLTPFDKVRANVIDDLEDSKREMIIGLNKRNPQVFDAYRIDVYTGKIKMVGKNPGNITGWMTDHEGNLRVAITTDGVNHSILYRDSEKEEFREIKKISFKETFSPVLFTYDDKSLYVMSNLGRDKTALIEYDPVKNKEIKLIFSHPDVDLAHIMTSKKRRKLTGVSYVTWKMHRHYFDKQAKAVYERLEKKLPGYEIAAVSRNRAEDKLIIRTYSDRSLGTYYLYDVDKDNLKHLADISPWLKEKYMAEMRPVSYKSRDGLTINGYLILPKGIEAKNLPVVVNPHGGPWHRDTWGFNPEVQFMANRGWAVFKMNFRGSTGYGRKFWEASFKQWGLKMQDDITDGVKWLIEKGIADPDRIAIYGGSYGGYATLAGLTFTPDLYACGVDYVGVSNLLTFMKTIPPYWKPYLEMMYEMVGDPKKEKEMLMEASPVFHVDQIKVPLFIAQGAKDPRVNKAESDQMVKALKKKGIDVPYLVKENEGHGFRNEENRFDFYREMEKFLTKCLKKEKSG